MNQTFVRTLEDIDCFHCHAIFGMTDVAVKRYQNNHKTFYCPYCQGAQSYNQESLLEKERKESQRLRHNLERSQCETTSAKQKARSAEYARRAEKGAKTRLKKGLCPCCRRTFLQLQRHMENQHPEYVEGK